MARSRRRTYRRRRRRARLLGLAVVLLIAAGAALLITRKPDMLTERIQQATPTPSAEAWDRTKVTREVTLPAETWYTIQTGVFSAPEAAQEKAGAYTERGAPGTVVQDGGKWRVFIASYGREDEAAAVRQRLGEVQRVETYLYRWTCPELRLRLTGMAGQLDAAEAGLTLFSQAAALLRDTATLLDAAQLTVEEALLAVKELDGQISLWVTTARERFGQRPPEMVQQLLTAADSWQTRRKAIEAADSVTTLSAELKGQGMQMFDEMIRMRAEMGAQ